MMLEELTTKFTVPKEGNNRSAYDFLNGKLAYFPSRKSLKKAFVKKLITRSEKVLSWDDILFEGDELIIIKAIPVAKPYHFELKIAYQDNHLAVLWKPAGIPVSGNVYKSIRNMLPYNLEPSNSIDAMPQPEPVHRLDRPTSGWLIVAKTFSAAKMLGEMFQKRAIAKTYFALVHGYFNGKAELTANVDGKSAFTNIKTVKIVKNQFGRYATLLEVNPITGRKHQIRVHLSSVGFPIFGDKQYQNNISTVRDKGLFLCAFRLSFLHPITNEKLNFNAPIPNKFLNKLNGEILYSIENC
jgi:23S rRNA pseudouridine1911/1915/1917 synthase